MAARQMRSALKSLSDPESFRTVAMPSYPDLRLALPGERTRG
jgi:hypothetical protein